MTRLALDTILGEGDSINTYPYRGAISSKNTYLRYQLLCRPPATCHFPSPYRLQMLILEMWS